jgi:radical SAM superfamily enzyme YgiQ (UPF0313 family)
MAEIYKEHPDVLCFSCYIWNIKQTLDICQDYKKVSPVTPIVLGGPEVSFDSVDLVNQHKFFDFVVCGEGELSLPELLEYIYLHKPLNEVQGVTYRNHGQAVKNPERPLISNLDLIPFPYSEGISDLNNRTIYFETSRGCPFNCTYCLSSTIKGVRFFSLDRVKQDLTYLINNQVKEIKFVDRTFNCNEERAIEIMKFLASNPGQTRFHFEICAELLSENMLDFLSSIQPGIFDFEIGVQSTYEPALDAVNRKYDWDKLKRNVTQIHSYNNIHLHLDLIAGLPFEAYSQFAQSFNMVYGLQPDVLQLGFLKLLKGSDIRTMVGKHEYHYQEEPPYQILDNKYLNYGEIINLTNIEELLSMYYNSERPQVSLNFLIDKIYGGNAFLFYEEFADYWEENELFQIGHKKETLYSFLKGFIDLYHSEYSPLLNDLIKYDFLSQHKAYELPLGIKRYNPENINDLLYSLLKDSSFISRYYPSKGKQSVSSIRKRTNLEFFQYNPKTQEKMKDVIPILFIYDPVTNTAVERAIINFKDI